MARSHICTGCGNELATLRAPPDPVYGLPLAVCPRCHQPSVRTRASVERGFRRAKRAMHSWLALMTQGLLAALFLTALAVPYLRVEDLVLRVWRLGWMEAFSAVRSNSLAAETRAADANAMLAVPLAIFVMGAVGVGAWLRFGLGHWKRPLTYGAWIAVAILFLTIPPLVELARSELVPHPRRIDGLRWDERAGRVVAAIASGLIAVAGAPLGRAFGNACTRQRSRVLARRRKRLRELRRPNA